MDLWSFMCYFLLKDNELINDKNMNKITTLSIKNMNDMEEYKYILLSFNLVY